MENSFGKENFILRKATSQDVAALYELMKELGRHEKQEQFIETNIDELMLAGFGTKNPKFEVVIAEANKKMIGYLSFQWNYSIWRGANHMHIDDLYLTQCYRGQGIGEALMHFAKKIALDKNVGEIRWELEMDNSKAIGFYQNLGAEIVTKCKAQWKI
jgi:ribosomal protein S18 acetylase RimI-like enzyme